MTTFGLDGDILIREKSREGILGLKFHNREVEIKLEERAFCGPSNWQVTFTRFGEEPARKGDVPSNYTGNYSLRQLPDP